MIGANTDLTGDWESTSIQTYKKIILKWIIKKYVYGCQVD